MSTLPQALDVQEASSRSPTPTFVAAADVVDAPLTSLVPATRTHAELEQGPSTAPAASGEHARVTRSEPHTDSRHPACLLHAADAEHPRARKRQRIESSPSSYSRTISAPTRTHMPLADSDASSLSGTPELATLAGPSSLGSSFEALVSTNGHRNGFGAAANGAALSNGNGATKHARTIAKVDLPGTALYDDSFIDREEFVRLVIQSLRDVGYVYVCAASLSLDMLTLMLGSPLPRSRQSRGTAWRRRKCRSSGSTSWTGCGQRAKPRSYGSGCRRTRGSGYAAPAVPIQATRLCLSHVLPIGCQVSHQSAKVP